MEHIIKTVKAGNIAPYNELSIIFSDLQKASEKIMHPNTAKLFSALAGSFEKQALKHAASTERGQTPGSIKDAIEQDLQKYIPAAESSAGRVRDRGALRATTWGKKVTAIQKSVVSRLENVGEELLKEGEAVFVCEACGFISLSKEPPEICPICKAPAGRFSRAKAEGGL